MKRVGLVSTRPRSVAPHHVTEPVLQRVTGWSSEPVKLRLCGVSLGQETIVLVGLWSQQDAAIHAEAFLSAGGADGEGFARGRRAFYARIRSLLCAAQVAWKAALMKAAVPDRQRYLRV